MIFVTGGAGYIGSHTCVELLMAGHDVTVYDNFSNSQWEATERSFEGAPPSRRSGGLLGRCLFGASAVWLAC